MRSSERPAPPAAVILAVAFAVALVARPSAQTVPAATCERLADQRLPNTTITAAQSVTAGSFTPPGSTNAMTNLPPFCRVAGVIAPTVESQILFEVWLPLEKWNGKFAGVGNGGWAGSISFGALRGPTPARLCDRLHEYRPRGGARHERRQIRLRKAGTADRLRLSLPTRNGGAGQGARAGVLRQGSRTLLFHRLLVGRIRRPDGSAAFPDRLRRHRRRRAGEQLDAAHGRRLRRRRWRSSGSGEQPSAVRRWACSIAARSRPATAPTASSTACSRIRANARSIRRR